MIFTKNIKKFDLLKFSISFRPDDLLGNLDFPFDFGWMIYWVIQKFFYSMATIYANKKIHSICNTNKQLQ